MTLTIDKLIVRGKISSRSGAASIDRISPGELSAECRRQLKGRWSGQTGVARIRQLRIRLKIPAKPLPADALVKAWTSAFLSELYAAFAHLHNVEIAQFQNRSEYLATAIRDLLNGVAGQRWAYEEFRHLFDANPAEAVQSLFRNEPTEAVGVLLILEDWGWLDRLLAVCNETDLEQLFAVVKGRASAARLSFQDLVRVAQLALEYRSLEIKLPDTTTLADRKIALKLFLRLARQYDGKPDIPPGTIVEVLRILRALLNLFSSVANRLYALAGSKHLQSSSILSGASLAERDRKSAAIIELLNLLRKWANSSPHEILLDQFWSMIATAPDSLQIAFAEMLPKLSTAVSSATQRQQLAALWDIITTVSTEKRMAFAELLADPTSAPSRGIESKWVSTDCAGLFLLVRVLDKLGWKDRVAQSSLGATYGPRLLTYTLAGVALAILGRFSEEPTHLDSGVALFSGWIEAPDLLGLRAFLAAGSVETRQDFLEQLLTQAAAIEYSASWQTGFDALASYLIYEFTEEIRCFGKPSRSFVVKNFLKLPGRILIEENRLAVTFGSSPLHVVIDLSRLDDPVESVSWFSGRRIEFQAAGF